MKVTRLGTHKTENKPLECKLKDIQKGTIVIMTSGIWIDCIVVVNNEYCSGKTKAIILQDQAAAGNSMSTFPSSYCIFSDLCTVYNKPLVLEFTNTQE